MLEQETSGAIKTLPTRSGPLFAGMWSSVLGAVMLCSLGCKFVFTHAPILFGIYLAKLVYVTFDLLSNMMKLAACLLEIISAPADEKHLVLS